MSDILGSEVVNIYLKFGTPLSTYTVERVVRYLGFKIMYPNSLCFKSSCGTERVILINWVWVVKSRLFVPSKSPFLKAFSIVFK